MGRALILIESLSAALLLVATATAWASRRRSRPGRWGVPPAIGLVVGVSAGLAVYGLGVLNGIEVVSRGLFLAAVGWVAAFVVGTAVVIPTGLRAGVDPAAGRAWSARSLAVAFAVAAVLTVITMSNLDAAVKGQLAAIRVEAGARALALAPPKALDGPNAAPIYRRAFAALASEEQFPVPLQNGTTFDTADPEQTAFLERQQRGLALLREAASVPRCSFDPDWSNDTPPLDLLIPEQRRLRFVAATLLAYDARVRASRGDTRGAVDDVVAIYGIARHIRFPILLDLFWAAGVEKLGMKAMEELLTLARPKPEDLARLTPGPSESIREQLRQAFVMDEAWGLAAITTLAAGRSDSYPEVQSAIGGKVFLEAILDSAVYRVFFLEDDLAAYRRHMRVIRDAVAKPAPELLDRVDEYERSLSATRRGGGLLTSLLLPASRNITVAVLEGDAARDLVRLALAATVYKAKHNKYPGALSELAPEFIPEVPADPFDGQPIRLRSDGNGVVLYSIGRDRKDDGGRPYEGAQGDLVFRLK